MTDNLYTQSDMDRELSALRERCAKAIRPVDKCPCVTCVTQRSLAAIIRALPITPHTEEGTEPSEGGGK